jgi:hypothetical protein
MRLITLLFLSASSCYANGPCAWYDTAGVSGPGTCFERSAFGQLNSITQQDCEEARNSNFHQKYCGGSAGGPKPPASCASSTGCLDAGARAQSGGLGKLDNLLGDMRTDADKLRDYQARRLDSAASTLDNWGARLGSTESKRQGDISGLQQDRNLVAKAMDNFAGKGPFSAEDAQRARDPSIRADLINYAHYKAGEDAFRQEISDREADRSNLVKMRDTTTARRTGLDSLREDRGGISAKAESASNISRAEETRSDAGPPTKGDTAASAKSETGPPGGGETAAAGDLRRRLREELARKLRDERRADTFAEATGNGGFEKKLVPLPHEADEAAARAAMLSDVLGDDSRRFGMPGSETDREVSRLLASASDLRADGVLDLESKSLFDRVRRAHRSCEERDCVDAPTRGLRPRKAR